MERIGPKTTITELLEEYPFLEDFLVEYNAKFALLKSSIMRATVGRVATLERVASIGEIELPKLLVAIIDEVRAKAQVKIEIEVESTDAPPSELGESVAAMKAIIEDLHAGLPFDDAKARFDGLIKDVAPGQIAQIEETLIKEGMPVSEVQRLCDLHVGVFKTGLEARDEVVAAPGHPVHTYMKENEEIDRLADRMGGFVARIGMSQEEFRSVKDEIGELLDDLSGLDGHYVRKENQLFPYLERHDVTGPSQVMWGVHNDIRELMKKLRSALESDDAPASSEAGTRLARSVTEMVYKENKILFPLAMDTLSRDEWIEVKRGEDELEYPFARPAADWQGEDAPASARRAAAAPTAPRVPETVALRTGELTLQQLTSMLTHLPVEISFVDAEGRVRFYSDHEDRIFPRSPAVIGRDVEKCHPPKSVDTVKKILAAFASGEKDSAEFWIKMDERLLLIRYHAVRDGDTFLGTLEVTQDVTDIRKLEGERRLLDWGEGEGEGVVGDAAS